MADAQPRRRPAPAPSAASFSALPPDTIHAIAELILEDVSPLWDRHDCLQLACNLAAVGNDGTTALASHLFAYLSPRLGEPGLGGAGQVEGFSGRGAASSRA